MDKLVSGVLCVCVWRGWGCFWTGCVGPRLAVSSLAFRSHGHYSGIWGEGIVVKFIVHLPGHEQVPVQVIVHQFVFKFDQFLDFKLRYSPIYCNFFDFDPFLGHFWAFGRYLIHSLRLNINILENIWDASIVFGSRLKTEEPIESGLCVRASVRACAVRYGLSQKPLRGFFRNLA
jgi:hypothetical protein